MSGGRSFLLALSLAVFLTASPQLNGSARATFPGGNGKIVFSGYKDLDQEIYIMNADGSGRINLTNDDAYDLTPRWSPDGTKIAFASDRSGNTEVYVMNANGTGVVNLSQNESDDRSPAWSPDGTKIAFTTDRDGNDEIYVMDSSSGSGQTNLTNFIAHEDDADWSPDGTKIAFAFGNLGDRDIAVMTADGSDSINVTNSPGVDEFDPSWSPSGARIAFVKHDDDDEIYVMNADGSDQINLTEHAARDLSPVWSPDGEKIAFRSTRVGGDDDIYVMNADGSGVVNLTSNYDPINSSPDWQTLPSGPPQLTAFFTWKVHEDDLLTVDFDGSGSTSPNGDIVSWEWDFDDGETGSGGACGGDPPLDACVQHTFPAPGVYNVRLEVTDDAGTAEKTFAVDVNTLDIDWKMEPRFGFDKNQDGLIDYVPDDVDPTPDQFDVDLTVAQFDGAECDSARSYRWLKDDVELPVFKDGCTFAAAIDAEGTYDIKVELDGHLVGRREVIVQDWLIVSIGDSIASGEGNPDRSILATGGDPVWQLERCHRSALSGTARAARKIEENDDHTSVTFVHLACSGATVFKGIIGAYQGIAPAKTDLFGLPSQLSQLESLIGDREIDVMLVSVGANDISFGTMATFCALWHDCPNRGFNDTAEVLLDPGVGPFVFQSTLPVPLADDSWLALHTVLDKRLAGLPKKYAALAEKLGPIVPSDRVYFTEYMDLTRDESTLFCNPMLDIVDELEESQGRPLRNVFDVDLGNATGIFGDESEWAYNGGGIGKGIVTGLNTAISQLPGSHEWHVIAGIEEPWAPHGYCSLDPWVQTLERSRALQGNNDGPLHPNAAGHEFTSTRIVEEVEKALYDDDGLPRLPESALSLDLAARSLAAASSDDTLIVELEEVSIDLTASTAVLGGTVNLSEGVTVACGDDVQLTLGESVFTQTVGGSAFQTTGSKCRYESDGSGIESLEYDLSAHSWRAALGNVDLTALTNPIDLSLSIGDDVGRDDAFARELPNGWAIDPDHTAPDITVIGKNPQVVLLGAPYDDPGATATDDFDGDVSADIEVDASGVDVSTLGSYVVGYRAADAAGNLAITIRGVDVAATTTTTLPGGGGECGDPVAFTVEPAESGEQRTITASDALVVLRAAVGSATCDACVCDVNDSGGVTASDALIVLRRAIGLSVELLCPACS
jgi:TolB protein